MAIPDRYLPTVIGGEQIIHRYRWVSEATAPYGGYHVLELYAGVGGDSGAPASGTVALDGPTLSALETINAVVTSGTVALDADTRAALENIIVSGTVTMDAPTLAALENITATISGNVSIAPADLAALESITATVSGTVELGAAALAALETIQVGNLPLATAVPSETGQQGILMRPIGTTSVDLIADLRNGVNKSRRVTLNATAATVTAIAIPDNARGIRLYPVTNDVRFALGEDPPATIATGAFGIGSIARADQFETRLLPTGSGRSLRLISTVSSSVVDVEVF